ncbi:MULTISPECIES: TetR/AcrR family transcriptional regulator [unclassified Oleiphilus]|nr:MULTISPECIES: TetR/AcrR family transcriptional regulator [unclassified Oleiphilus]
MNVICQTLSEKSKSRSELKREAIIDAARKAFKEYGVDATSMDKLAEIAQVSKRTVYNHFDSKEALVMYLLKDLWDQAMVKIDVHYDAVSPLGEQLTALLKQEVNLVGDKEYIDLARVALGHFLFQPEALQKELEKFDDEDTALTLWLESASKDKRLNLHDTELAFTQLHNLIKGSCFWPQVVQIAPVLSEPEKQALVRETVDMFLARYK